MRRIFLSLILILFVIINVTVINVTVANVTSARMSLSVEGLSGALKDNVDARLSLIDPGRIDDTPYFRRSLETEIRRGLRALGYYAPTFRYSVSESSNKLIVTVDPGRPVLIERIDVNITGEGQHDKDYISLVNTVPEIGTILNHNEYDGFRKSLQNLALRKGYFDSELTRHQLAVADGLHQAFWKIDFNTGKRYRLGSVTFNDSMIRESYLRNIIPFEENEFYTSDQLSLLHRRLSSTNWFNSVSVIPLFNKVDDNKVLPIHVITTPRKKNIINVGLGYSNDNGMGGRLRWNKPWLNDRGHSFQSELVLSSPEQSITAAYKIPLYGSPLEDYYTIQGGYKKVDNNDTYSNSYTFGVIRNWDSFEGWQSAVGLNVMFDNFTQASDSYDTFLLYPSFSFSRIRTDGSLFPMWGDSQRYSLEAAAKKAGSDINFIRFQVQHAWIRSLADEHRFIARANLGLIQADDFDRVPPSFRFFAGGDKSVRGYSYQSISPTDSSGKLKGASRLFTGSLEYQYNITGSWWSAVFVDVGDAVDNLNQVDLHTGTGFGIRWASPVGPIKLDLATPVSRSKNSVHFYIGLGAEL